MIYFTKLHYRRLYFPFHLLVLVSNDLTEKEMLKLTLKSLRLLFLCS